MTISVYVTTIKAILTLIYSLRELRDIYNCDLNLCPFLFPLPLSRNQIALLKIRHISSGWDKKKSKKKKKKRPLCLKASTGKPEKFVNCFEMRQNGVGCAFWRRAALCVGAFVKFCVTHAPHYNAHNIHISDPEEM